jgi:hypothetical protein
MKHYMNRKAWTAVACVWLPATFGCGTTAPRGETTQNGNGAELSTPISVQRVESAITSMCRLSTVGLPCDPDGVGSATECEGLCWIDDAALVSCRPVAELNMTAIDLNGRICGDVEGRNCGQSCENGQCVDKNARLGTACRPTNNSSTCEGVCTLADGEPTCDTVTVCGNVGISEDGCELTACNFDEYQEGCQLFELDNAVCDASNQPAPIEAGVDELDAAVPDAAATSTDVAESSTSPAPDAAASSTSGGMSTDVEETSSFVAADAAPGIDGGDADGGDVLPPIMQDTAVKVVGGACSAGRNPGHVAWAWLSLSAALLIVRRRR